RLLELRAEVSRALEAARRDRLIGSSLDATVNLTPADEEHHHFLTKNVALLENLIIVSKIHVRPPAQAADGQTDPIEVTRASGQKCERCWKIDTEVGRDARHPDLCPRCADVVERI